MRGSKWLMAACLVHAALVTAFWIIVFRFDIDVMSGRLWMAVALIWPLWAIAAVLSPRATIRAWVGAGVVGLVVLLPVLPTLYTFVVWSIGGFAP